MSMHKTRVEKDFDAKTVKVSREFAAPLAMVWRAYTESELLDQWWGPEPYHVETSRMDFVAGGHWLYAMVGPEGQRHWGRMNYIDIQPQMRITIEDGFCDEQGNINPGLPVSRGEIVFTPVAGGTRVEFSMTYERESDVRKIVEMGFEQGISICLEQLEALLARQAGRQP